MFSFSFKKITFASYKTEFKMNKDSKRREALLYHAKPSPGKIQVIPTKKYATQRDLLLAL